MLTYGSTHPDGAARVKLHSRRQYPLFRGSTMAPIGAIKRDSTAKRHEPVQRYAPELLQAARQLGVSAAYLAGMLKLQRKYG